MHAYLLRRLLYAIPILIGVNLITFALFFTSRAQGANVLTGPVFDVLPKFAGLKVIYAAAKRMGGRAVLEGIAFKQTPYALEV